MCHPPCDTHCAASRAPVHAWRAAAAHRVVAAVACYTVATCIVAIGLFARSSVLFQGGSGEPLSVFRWDGSHYIDIARTGYSYDAAAKSLVAFFPAYPLSARFLARLMGIDLRWAMVITANGYLIGAFLLLSAYVRGRFAGPKASCSAGVPPAAAPRTAAPQWAAGYALLAFGLFPTSFFFRMPYSESCFLFFALLAMLGMERRWPLPIVAVIVGLATATRPVAIALVPVFWLHVWRGSAGPRAAAKADGTRRVPATFVKTALLTPIAAWGLLAYMGYQYAAFGDPLAFAKTQEHWTARNDVSTADKVPALLSYEPIWSVYDRDSPSYWRRIDPDSGPLVNLTLANPIYFLLAIALVVLGRWKGWLNAGETLLGGLLIFIPYVTRSYEMCMLSQGRFVAVAFPIYLVLGQLLGRIPGPCAALILCFCALLLVAYSALFAAGNLLI